MLVPRLFLSEPFNSSPLQHPGRPELQSDADNMPPVPPLLPARSTVQVAGLPKDALVEIELVAAL